MGGRPDAEPLEHDMSLRPRRSRKARRSGDEVIGGHLTRNPTYGAGLNELDEMLDELDEIHQATPAASPRPSMDATDAAARGGGLGFATLLTSLLVVALAVSASLVVQRPSACDDTCEHAGDGSCDDGAAGAAGGACARGTDCSDCGPRDVVGVPHWALILIALVCTAVLTLGVRTCAAVGRAWRNARPATVRTIPLTDATICIGSINKMANSAQVREKCLKIVQYLLRLAAYSAVFSKEASAQMKALSKVTSVARRCFKFLRWVKHFEDLAEAAEQRSKVMRALLYFRILTNFGADWAEDVCSLERVGFLPKGTLSAEFMLFAEFCQLALALVEIFVTTVRARKEGQVADLADAMSDDVAPPKLLAQRRKLAIVRLELVKFVSDVGKALYDCELQYAHEGIFIGCALFSALLSTHKNMFKIFK